MSDEKYCCCEWMSALDVLVVVATSFGSMLLSEGLSWIFVYRSEAYQAATARVRQLGRKYELAKRQDPLGKKVVKYREQLKAIGAQTGGSNWKSMLFLGLLHWLTFSTLSRRYEGVVVARLPFVVQFGLLQGFSHRGLLGSDFSEGSFLFLFIMCTFLRHFVQRALGVEAPKNPCASSWGMPDDSDKK